MPDPSWYVLHTRSRFEKVACDCLLKKSIEAFLPKVRVRSRRRDRKVMLDLPLFPGYLFVKSDLDAREYLQIVQTAGIVRVIGNNSGPQKVDEAAIDSLKIMLEAHRPITTGHGFKKGDMVKVLHGPFAGMTGIFVRCKAEGRVMVEITALGQFASVDVSCDHVALLSTKFIITP